MYEHIEDYFQIRETGNNAPKKHYLHSLFCLIFYYSLIQPTGEKSNFFVNDFIVRPDSSRTRHREVCQVADGDLSGVSTAGHLQVVLSGLYGCGASRFGQREGEGVSG